MVNEEFYDETWNMAKAYYYRIDQLLTACSICHISGKGLLWYKNLYRLYVEIQAKMKPEQREKALEMLNELTTWKNQAIKKDNGSIPTAKFIGFELFLRQILEDKNMLTPKPEDTRGL